MNDRPHRVRRRQMFGGIVVVALLGAGGSALLATSTHADTGYIDRNDVASQISSRLAQQVGRKPGSVSCPSDLSAAVGARLRCDLTDGGQIYGVTVIVTDITASGVDFDFRVDNAPK